jgi:ECF transporter S component (folate family)
MRGVFPLTKKFGSARGGGGVRTVAVCGMLLALRLILGVFTVNVGSLLKVGFSYLPVAAAGLLLGPVAGGVVGAAGDVLGYFLQPTGPYFPGFTLNAFLSGCVYGLVLYRRPVGLARTFAAKAAITVLVSIILNPLWLSILYGKAFFTVVSARIVTNLILLPIETAVLYALLKIMERSRIVRTD